MWLWTVRMSFSVAPAYRHQMEVDRQEVFADDVEPGCRQQMVNVGDASGDRVLDRDHRQFGLALLDRREAVLEGRAGHRLVAGIDFAAGQVGIRSGFPLEHDLLRTRHVLLRLSAGDFGTSSRFRRAGHSGHVPARRPANCARAFRGRPACRRRAAPSRRSRRRSASRPRAPATARAFPASRAATAARRRSGRARRAGRRRGRCGDRAGRPPRGRWHA